MGRVWTSELERCQWEMLLIRFQSMVRDIPTGLESLVYSIAFTQ